MKKWSNDEVEQLRKIYKSMTARQLADYFGRSERAIHVKCFHLGLKKGYNHAKIKLSSEDVLWLKLNFPHMRNEICALRLGLSLRTVVRLARSYGLEKTPQFMKECQMGTAIIAKRKRAEKGLNPPKGWYSPNLQKGKPFQFQPKTIK